MSLIKNDLRDKAVLLIEGTTGVGLHAALRLAREGARVFLTCGCGSVDGQQMARLFAEAGVQPPNVVEADAAQQKDTERALRLIREQHDRVEVLVSDAAIEKTEGGLDHYDKHTFLANMGGGAWPMVGYLQQIKRHFGHYPRYAIALSCDNPNTYCAGRDFAAAARAVQDVFCRYLASHLLGQDARVNVLGVRPLPIDLLTHSDDIEHPPLRARRGFVGMEEVADAVLALCSGLLDGVSGQVMLLGKGRTFGDPLLLGGLDA